MFQTYIFFFGKVFQTYILLLEKSDTNIINNAFDFFKRYLQNENYVIAIMQTETLNPNKTFNIAWGLVCSLVVQPHTYAHQKCRNDDVFCPITDGCEKLKSRKAEKHKFQYLFHLKENHILLNKTN